MNATVTRFAPSPTGSLHLGHAFSALFAEAAARAAGGRFLLRIEDIDAGRCRPEFEDAIYQDLAWLGLEWETPVRRQSDHLADYAAALTRLGDRGLIYPCFCTRADIRAEIEAAGGAPHGPDGPLYPGTCRALPQDERRARIERGDPHGLRLDAGVAARQAGELAWRDDGAGEVAVDAGLHGDVVLARKDTPTSYHLAVTIDDHLQGVSLVTRGEDLFAATHVHRLLTNAAGVRLAKRDRAVTIRALRGAGKSAQEVRQMAGFES